MPASLEKRTDRPALIAGFGSVGRRHFRNLQALGYKQFVFFRTHQGTVPDDELAVWPTVNDLDAAWTHGPAIAVISNPSAQHMAVARASAEAGCDLLIEKPLSASLDGCDELAAMVRRRGLVAMVGCQYRFHPLLVRLRERVLAGELGTMIGARAEWGEYLPDWHPWEDHRQSYSARPELGGGVVLTLIHPLDYCYWLFGAVTRVQGATRGITGLQTPAGEDWAEITLEFQSGVVAQIHLDYWQRPPVHRLAVWGERGRADLDFQAGTLRWEMVDSAANTTESVPSGFDRNAMFVDEMRHFLDCVEQRRDPLIPIEQGIDVLKIALDAKQSAAEARSLG